MNDIMTKGGGGIVPQGSNAIAQMGQAREVAEAISAMQVAKAFPRDIVEIRAAIANECARPALAEKAVYQYSKGGSEVTGPSIRLAEAIAQNWGNMQFGVRELDQRNGVSTCEAFAWDMQRNVKQTKVFQVSHIRHTRQGDKVLTDPREIYELVANNGARRVRACILGIIPGDIVDEAVAECDKTLKANIDCSPERVKKMVDTFKSEFGVAREQIEARIQCRIDAIRPAQFANLVKIYRSLKDGMSNAGDWFEPVKAVEAGTAAAANNAEKKTLAGALGIAKETPKNGDSGARPKKADNAPTETKEAAKPAENK